MPRTKRITRARAFQLARQYLGAYAACEDRGAGSESSPPLRADASARLQEHRANRPQAFKLEELPQQLTVKAALEWRANAAKQYMAWRNREYELQAAARSYRYVVGTVPLGAIGFYIAGEGDTWVEALTKAGVPEHEFT